MSLARQRLVSLCRPARRPFSAVQVRFASSDSPHHEDTNVYPPESFNTPFWRNTALLTLLGFGVYQLVPYLDKDGDYIIRYIQHYATPSEVWTRINNKHLAQALDVAHGQVLISTAERPRIHRMRHPALLDNGSPHCVAVGSQADVSDVVVKKDKLWTE